MNSMAILEITPLIGCKVQCDFCPQSLLMTRYADKNNLEKITFGSPTMMSFETFKTCIDKTPKHVEIRFAGYSECWLHPQATKMLLYAHEKGHKIEVYTTMVGMREDDVERFKQVPFGIFDLHLPDKQMYAKIRINESFLKVLKKIISSNISNLRAMTMGDLPEEIIDVIGRKFPANFMQDRAGNNEIGEKTAKIFGPIICGMGSDKRVNFLNANVLLPNGDVCLCCQDYGMDHIFGNLLTDEYHSLFEGKKLANIIQKLNDNDSEIMCRNCSYAIPKTRSNVLRQDIVQKIKHTQFRKIGRKIRYLTRPNRSDL